MNENPEKLDEELINSIPESYQRYLEQIFLISKTKKGGWVTNKEIAEKLSVEPASVSAILRKLKNKDLINWKPKHPIRLTRKGKEIALYLCETESLLEILFREVLHIKDEETIHQVSCEVEHHITSEIKLSLEKFLRTSGYLKIRRSMEHDE